jgi:hypothetical protein
LPEPSSYTHQKFSFKQEYKELNGRVILETQIVINFLVVEGEDMQLFREMITRLNKSYLQSIALQKK